MNNRFAARKCVYTVRMTGYPTSASSPRAAVGRYLLAALLFQATLPLVLAFPGTGLCDAARLLAERDGHGHGHNHAEHDHHAGGTLVVCLCALKQLAQLGDADAVVGDVPAYAYAAHKPASATAVVRFHGKPVSHWRARAPPSVPTA